MSTYHAVVWMDQKEAHVLQFDTESMQAQRVKSRSHHLRQASMPEKDQAAYFDQICGALAGVHEVLLVGPGLMHDEFKAWAAKHQPAVAKTIVASEKADHPTDGQLVAMARRFFHKFDNMAADPGAH